MKFQVGDFVYYPYANSTKVYGIIIKADDQTFIAHWINRGKCHSYPQSTRGFFKVGQ